MILVVEKRKNRTTGKTTKDKTGFSTLSNAMRYAADWLEMRGREGASGAYVEVWKKQVKFGFVAYYEYDDQREITFEELAEGDPCATQPTFDSDV